MREIKYRTEFPELLEHLGLKGDAVEIGVAEGRNAAILIASPSIEKIYLIDNWSWLAQSGDGSHPQHWHDNNLKEVNERIQPFKEKAVILKGMSTAMIKQIPEDSLIFAYIDADHAYNGCFNDLINIYPKVKIGGVVALHDVKNPSYGVGMALANFLVQNGYDGSFIHFTEEDGDELMVSAWFIKK
jgi:Methyltransferase domain